MGVRQEARRFGRGRWVERLGRLGLASMGISYGVVAVLALELALGIGGKATDRQGALHALAGHPVGKLLLIVLAIGFAGYAAWRISQAVFNRGGEDDDAKGFAKRLSELGKAAIYLGLFVETVGTLLGRDRQGGGAGERGITAWLLRQSGGKWVVVAIGLAVVGAGLWNLYRALSGQFLKHLKENELKRVTERWVVAVAAAGYSARGVVFCLIGVFVVHAAWVAEPRDAIGLDGALRKLAHGPHGAVLLGVVSAGLLAYAVYSLVQARYRDV